MNAYQIATKCGGAKKRGDGKGWMCRCPAHDDHQPSMAISDTDGGRVLVWCFVCQDNARVIAALKARGLWEWQR